MRRRWSPRRASPRQASRARADRPARRHRAGGRRRRSRRGGASRSSRRRPSRARAAAHATRHRARRRRRRADEGLAAHRRADAVGHPQEHRPARRRAASAMCSCSTCRATRSCSGSPTASSTSRRTCRPSATSSATRSGCCSASASPAPKVGIVAAVETVNPAIPATARRAGLVAMAQRGRLAGRDRRRPARLRQRDLARGGAHQAHRLAGRRRRRPAAGAGPERRQHALQELRLHRRRRMRGRSCSARRLPIVLTLARRFADRAARVGRAGGAGLAGLNDAAPAPEPMPPAGLTRRTVLKAALPALAPRPVRRTRRHAACRSPTCTATTG